MNWRALTEHPWLDSLRTPAPDRFARMRDVVQLAQADPAIRPPRPRYDGKPWKHVLLVDARGRSLFGRCAHLLFHRRAA